VAQREQGEHRVFHALARYGPGGAYVAEHQPVAARIALQGEGGGIRDDGHVPFGAEAGQQIGARGERIAHQIHIAVAGRQVSIKAQCGIAVAGNSQFP
jgi:sRNA-binding protein